MVSSSPFLVSFVKQCRDTYLHFIPGKLSHWHYDISVTYNWINLAFKTENSRGMDDVFIRLVEKTEVVVDIAPGDKAESICFISEQGMKWISLVNEGHTSDTRNPEPFSCHYPLVLNEKERDGIEKCAKALHASSQQSKELLKILLIKPIVDIRCNKSM